MAEIKHPETKALRSQIPRTANREHVTPIYMTSSFLFDDLEHARALFAEEAQGNVYSRYSNPNTSEFILKMCALEKTEAGLPTCTGMAAMFLATAGLLRNGDHFLASRSLFNSNFQIFSKILPKWGVECSFVDLGDQENWGRLIRKNTKLLFLETPSNPGLDLADLEAAGKLCRERGLVFIVDNCFATPILQNPVDFGADLVCHSATKFIDGQGRFLGGCVLGRQKIVEELMFFFRHTGPTLSAFNAWALAKSLETMPLRVGRQCETALKVAQALESMPEVKWVKYPFLKSHPDHALAKKQMRSGGSLLCLELKGGLADAEKFMDGIGWLSHTPNFGDGRSIVTHPRHTTHSKLTPEEREAVGISDGMIRLSIGLEHEEDLIAQIEEAIAATR